MKPRDFLNFFKTKSGKLVLFAALFGGGLVIFSALRNKSHGNDDLALAVRPAQTNATDKPQVVQSVELPMQPFHPPPPKPEPLPVVKTNEPPKVIIEHRPEKTPNTALPPISLFADSTPTEAPKKTVSSVYAPFGRLIPCETVITVDSASIQTPIIGLLIYRTQVFLGVASFHALKVPDWYSVYKCKIFHDLSDPDCTACLILQPNIFYFCVRSTFF